MNHDATCLLPEGSAPSKAKGVGSGTNPCYRGFRPLLRRVRSDPQGDLPESLLCRADISETNPRDPADPKGQGRVAWTNITEIRRWSPSTDLRPQTPAYEGP